MPLRPPFVIRPSSFVICSLLLTACCPTIKPIPGGRNPNLPPPISLNDQVQRLNAYARQIPFLKATTITNGVRMTYRDDAGKDHEQTVEGTLLLHQRFWEAGPAAGCDVLLLGTSFNQRMLFAGANQRRWWFAIYIDPKTAWVGDVRDTDLQPHDTITPGRGGGRASMFRAQIVPDLLGITEITLKYGELAVLRVNDDRGTNDLMIEGFGADGTTWLKREIIINRITGDVDQVSEYDPSGVLLVRSTLAHYAPAALEVEGRGPGPRLPRSVKIDYPAEMMTLELTFATLQIPATLSDTKFQTPDFTSAGLRVVNVDH